MAHKTITISEEAYKLLKSRKKESESFTDVIIRIIGQKQDPAKLLQWIQTLKDSSELAQAVEESYRGREKVSLRF